MYTKYFLSLLSMAALCFDWVEVRTNQSMTGGWQRVDPKKDSVQDVAHFATKAISNKSNSKYTKKLVHVHEAMRQVVAGVKYNVTIDIGNTVCVKTEANADTEDKCALSKVDPIDRCLATVWDRPWLKERQLLHFDCRLLATRATYFSDKFVADDQAYHKNDPKKLNTM